MKKAVLSLFALLLGGFLMAQKLGIDSLAGYILNDKDTITGKVILSYQKVKQKKQYNDEEWYQQVTFVDGSGKERILIPSEISGYGWSWNDTSKVMFRSFQVAVPRTGAHLMKGHRKPFLQLEIEGPMTLYQYYHRESSDRLTALYRDRYLINEKGEIEVFKIKSFLGVGFNYNLSHVAVWFGAYPELPKFNMANMSPTEIMTLLSGYNKWKKDGH